ncbi:MAG: ABC transporter permease [Gammaproteobacteria bacterium]|nr:ABC transporter permease [Gammaproteobacteria bacterium]
MVVGLCAYVGEVARAQNSKLLQLAAIVSAALMAAFRPVYWRRTIRNAFARQVLSSGVEAIGIIGFLGIALGVLLVLQYQVWLGNIVQSLLLGPVFVAVVVRELAPLLVNLVVIARSGGTMAAELALIHVSGEDRVAEGQGLDPLAYFVIPRVLALTLSVLCLTLIFTACSFLSVYIFGQWIDAKTGSFWDFSYATLSAITTADVVNLLVKSTVPAMLTGCISCAEGLGAGDRAAEVPRASRIAVQRSVIALFSVSALVSIATYS